MPEYGLYGLVIRSDCVLAGLEVAVAGAGVDVDIRVQGPRLTAAEWADRPRHYLGPAEDGGVPSVEVRGDASRGFWFRYADGTQFVVDRDARTIGAWWDEGSTLEDTATYLLGPILGFVLRLRGVLALHASAVLLDGRAVAMLGPSGAGKSTTAAAFAAAGVPVLCDDVLAVRQVGDVAMAYPSYGLLRLWDSSEQMLFGTVGQLPLLTPTWDKRALPLGGRYAFHRAPAPLGELFVLAPRVTDDDAPRVEELRPREGFIELVANSYANYLLDDRMRGDEMRALGAMLRGRRVRRLVPHADPARLEALVELIGAAVHGP
ncbi:MAG TPA: hypothetical protein VIK25_11910 [Gemmatimonadaceae bacterium]